MSWWGCEECGYEFGFEQLPQPDGACSLGVPVPVRQAPSAGSPVFLGQIGRKPGG